VSLGKEDRDVLRFLWVNAEGDLRIFRHARVAFGVTSSPFLLGAVIDFHLKRCLAESEQNEWYERDLIEKLKKSFYVNNCHKLTRLQCNAFVYGKSDRVVCGCYIQIEGLRVYRSRLKRSILHCSLRNVL